MRDVEHAQKRRRNIKKPPKGTMSNPWLLVPEEYDKRGNIIKGHFIRITNAGVWKVTTLPSDAIIRLSTSY